MSEVKRQYTDGQNKFLITDKQAAELNKGRPGYLPPITPVDDDAKVRVTYRNSDDELVDEVVPWQNVQQRAAVGQNVVADKASIEQARQEAQVRERLALADREDLTTLAVSALPGAQPILRAVVGEEDATQGLVDLQQNVLAGLVGNLAELAIGGRAIGLAGRALLGADRAVKAGKILGLAKDSSKLSKVGRVAAEEVIADAHFMVQNQLDRGGDLVAEDWAQQLGTGLVFGSPFIAGAALRGVGQKLGQAVGPNLLGTARTALTTMAVFSPKGSGQAATYARAAAGSGLVGKLIRRVRKKGLAQTDEAVELGRQLELDYYHARDQVTPAKLDGMAPGKRADVIEQYRRYAEDPTVLDKVDFDNMVPAVKRMGEQVDSVRREALNLHKQLLGNGVADIKMTDRARDNILAHANDLLKHVEDAGMVDVKNAIRRGIIDGGGDAATMHKALFEAKVNARFRRGVSGGADIVDDKVTAFLLDKNVGWTAKQIKKNAELLSAVDDVVKVWDDLGDIRVPKRTKDYEALQVADGLALGKNQESIARLETSVDTLRDAGLLSDSQVAAFKTKMVQASDALSRGTKAYGDVLAINKARNNSLAKLKKQRDLIGTAPDTPESFQAARYDSAMDTMQQLGSWAATGIDAFLSTKPLAYANRVTGALHGMSAQEKREVFADIHRELTTLAGNPMYLIESLTPLIDRGAAADPRGADLAAQKVTNMIFYLQSQLPPVDDTLYGRGVPQPLSAIEEYMEKFFIALDPISAGYEIYSGTITPQMVAALRATNPAIYAQMQVELVNVMARVPGDKANPKVVAAANIFMGGMDPLYSGKFIAELQSSYAQTATQDAVINGPRRPVRNPGAESSLTTSQRQQTY